MRLVPRLAAFWGRRQSTRRMLLLHPAKNCRSIAMAECNAGAEVVRCKAIDGSACFAAEPSQAWC